MKSKPGHNVCHFSCTGDVKLSESKTKSTGQQNELGMLCSEAESNLPFNYTSDVGQLYSLERRHQRKLKFGTKNTLKKIVKKIKTHLNSKALYFPYHQMIKPNTELKVHSPCMTASKQRSFEAN